MLSQTTPKAIEWKAALVIICGLFSLLHVRTLNRTVKQFAVQEFEFGGKAVQKNVSQVPIKESQHQSKHDEADSIEKTQAAPLDRNAGQNPPFHNSSKYSSLWHQRFGTDNFHKNITQPRKYIFFKHVRKAGGTFLRSYLESVRLYHSNAATPKTTDFRGQHVSIKEDLSEDPNLVSFYEQEFAAMDWRCSDVDPRWNHTISITVLREPVARQLSEFLYSGIKRIMLQKKNHAEQARKLMDLHWAGNYSVEFFHLCEIYIPMWMKSTDRDVQVKGVVTPQFLDEFQVRVFSGNVPPEKQSIGNNAKFPCAYGSQLFGGGTSVAGTVNDERLRKAKTALSRFDIILMSETMGKQAAMVADMLDVPIDIASLAKDGNKVVNSNGIKEKKVKLVDYMAHNAPNAFALLQNVTHFESQFYNYAVQLNHQRYSEWDRIKSDMAVS
jgi:hypothetical protein